MANEGSEDKAINGAHYHAARATEKWKGYVEGVQAHATRTQAARDRADRDKKAGTTYERAAEAQKEGS
jgi:hypothetical protein